MASADATVLIEATQIGFEKIEKGLKDIAGLLEKATKNTNLFESVLGKLDSNFEQAALGSSETNVELKKITEALSSLNSVATTTTKGVSNLEKAFNKTSNTIGKNVKEVEGAVNDIASQANRFVSGNLMAQFQDVIVSAQMGMRPLTIAMQQGTQILAAFVQSKNVLADLVAGFKSLISPVALLTVGLTGLVAAGIQMVDWTGTAQKALNGLAKVFDWVAENSGIVAAAIGLIATELSIHIIKIVAWKEAWNTTVNFIKNIQWGKIGEGILKFLKMLINPWLLIPALIMSALEAFALFPDGIKKALNVAIDFIVSWVNKAVGLFNAVIDVATHVPVAIKEALSGKEISSIINDFNKIISDDINKNYINSEKIKNVADGAIDVVSNGVKKVNNIVSSSVKSMSELASKGLKSMAEGLGENTKDAEKLQKAIGKVKEAYEDAIFSNQIKIEDLRFTELTKGMTDEEKIVAQVNREYEKQLKDLEAKAKAENLSLQYFKEYKKQLQDQKIEQTNLELQTYKNEEAQKAWNSAMDYGASLTKTFFSDLKSGLQEGQSAWEAFTNAVLKMLDKIADKMMDLAIDSMFDSLKQSGGKSNNWMSTAVNAIASAFTGGSNKSVDFASAEFASTVGIKPTIPAAQGGVFSNGIYSSPTMFKFAKGSKFGVMGEAGPEAVMPLHRSPDGSLGVRADGMGGSSPVIVNVINNSNARATTQERQTEQGTTIDVMIDELVAQKLSKTGTASNQALTAFNNRQLIAR